MKYKMYSKQNIIRVVHLIFYISCRYYFAQSFSHTYTFSEDTEK